MPSSIYSSLFTYHPRPNRAPLEDFLSEALADLLNRLPTDEHVRFVGHVLLSGAARAAWSDFAATAPFKELRWATQVRVAGGKGIIDMVLLVDGKPAVVVENKVAAAVRDHAAPEEAGPAEGEEPEKDGLPAQLSVDGNQLRTYGKWLAAQRVAGGWPGALVLLTHASAAPADYGASDYGVPLLCVCRWRQVRTWALEGAGPERASGDTGAAWMMLKAELATFLERMGMSAEFMTPDDIARAQVFMPAAQRIDHTFAAVADRLWKLKDTLGLKGASRVYYESSAGLVWAWSYLAKPSGAQWYFSWGLRFPETAQRWNDCAPPLPKAPHAFVNLGTERRKLPLSSLAEGALSQGWSVAGEVELVAAKPLREFPPEAEAFAAALAEWVAEEIERFQSSLDTLVEAAQQPTPV